MSKVRLTPYWWTPKGQAQGEEIAFKLRPLTEPEMVDVEESYNKLGQPTNKSYYIAGTLGIVEVKGARHPETQKLVSVPDFTWLPRQWVQLCGARLYLEDRGYDWDSVSKIFETGEKHEEAAEENPEKN